MALPDWPTLTLEIAGGTSPNNTWITFGSAFGGAKTFDHQTFAPDAIFTDVTADHRGITVTRGRGRALDHFNPASMQVTFDNTAASHVMDYRTVAPNTLVRLRATYAGVSYWLFNGYVDSVAPNYMPGNGSYTSVTMSCSDGFKPLQRYQPSAAGGVVGAGDDTGTRVGRILDEGGWSATDRELNTGNSTLQAVALGSTSALDDIYTAVDSERGQFYIAPNGDARFENRWYRLSNASSVSPQFIWSDTYAQLAADEANFGVTGDLYTSVNEVWDDTLVANNVTGQIVGSSNPQNVTDTTSITDNFSCTYNNTSLQLQTDADALHWARWVLFNNKTPAYRVESITVEPLGNPTVQFPEVLGRQISDLVVVDGTGFVIGNTAYFVEGVSHHITTGDGGAANWVTTFTFSPGGTQASTPLVGFFIFDDPVFGKFDGAQFAEF